MISLDQHNELQNLRNRQAYDNKSMKNGIECPKCKSELWDSNPRITLTSNPPQKDVNCFDCGYTGYRIA